MMKRLAVINCKKAKASHPCSAEEMYNKSAMFRAMRDFVKAYYDEYVILSAKYGVLLPTDTIEPYSKVIGRNGYSAQGERNFLSADEEKKWAEKVISHPVWSEYDTHDFHVSQKYFAPLKAYFPNATVIPLPPNTGFVVRHYQWLLRDLQDKKPIDFSFRERPGMPAHPDKIWYHPIHGEFFGNDLALYQVYGKAQTLDLPTLIKVDNGKKNRVNHHKGWCLRREVLERLYFDSERNQWRSL